MVTGCRRPDHVNVCHDAGFRLSSLQANIMSYTRELSEMQAAKNQKLAMFGQHAQLRAEVDKRRCDLAAAVTSDI